MSEWAPTFWRVLKCWLRVIKLTRGQLQRSRLVITDLIVFKRNKEQNAGGVLTVSLRAPVF